MDYRVRKHRSSEKFEPRWIDVIPFDRKLSFFVPALEQYLIHKCMARGEKLVNKVGTFPGMVESLARKLKAGALAPMLSGRLQQ